RDEVVIISHDLWRRRFNSDTGVVGKAVALNGRKFVVVGVTPESLMAPTGRQLHALLPFGQRIDVWTPWAATNEELQGQNHNCAVLVRLKDSESITRGRKQLTAIMNGWMKQTEPNLPDWNTRLVPLREVYSGKVRLRFLVILGASSLLLLIA